MKRLLLIIVLILISNYIFAGKAMPAYVTNSSNKKKIEYVDKKKVEEKKTTDEIKPAREIKLNVSMGLVGLAYFTNQNRAIFTSNFGGLIRITYPIFGKQKDDGSYYNYFDMGLGLFTSAITVNSSIAYCLGGGWSFGFLDGIITVTLGGSWVVNDIFSEGFFSVIVTSDVLKF